MNVEFEKEVELGHIDNECIALCRALNDLDGVETEECCCGHTKYPYRIWFRCNNFISLAIIARAIDRRYCGTKFIWSLTSETSDIHPCFLFRLDSLDKFDNSYDMLKDATEIVKNIYYWKSDEFKNYFEKNYYRWEENN